VRVAAAAALGEGAELHPAAVGEALQGAIQLYGGGSSDDAARAGAAAALRALAPHLSPDQLTATLDFLLSRGLADGTAAIREAMVAAGAAPLCCVQCCDRSCAALRGVLP
jgi:hypothetical protein